MQPIEASEEYNEYIFLLFKNRRYVSFGKEDGEGIFSLPIIDGRINWDYSSYGKNVPDDVRNAALSFVKRICGEVK